MRTHRYTNDLALIPEAQNIDELIEWLTKPANIVTSKLKIVTCEDCGRYYSDGRSKCNCGGKANE